MKFIPQSWNDTLSLILLVAVPVLWLKANLSGEVNGALIATWTLIVQFYFRKAKTEQ